MKLIISLDGKSKDFIHGMELGIILQKAENGLQIIDNNCFPLRDLNIQKAKEICFYYGYIPIIGESKNGYTTFLAIKNNYSKN